MCILFLLLFHILGDNYLFCNKSYLCRTDQLCYSNTSCVYIENKTQNQNSSQKWINIRVHVLFPRKRFICEGFICRPFLQLADVYVTSLCICRYIWHFFHMFNLYHAIMYTCLIFNQHLPMILVHRSCVRLDSICQRRMIRFYPAMYLFPYRLLFVSSHTFKL